MSSASYRRGTDAAADAANPSDYAAGRAAIPDDAEPQQIRVASKDYNARGRCREHWYRVALRGGEWVYFEGSLPVGNYLAADRRATLHGDVYVGELIAQHDRGGPIDVVYLVTGGDDVIQILEWRKRRDGQLAITLPDGTEVLAPNPRK
jgi:hypothetical protein